MKKFLILTMILMSGYSLQAQEKVAVETGVQFAEYDMQISSQKGNVDAITPPLATTDCELEDPEIQFTFKDVTFSGGKHGTLERTWIATDACGNSATTIQYIALREDQ